MDYWTPFVAGAFALVGGWLGAQLAARRDREERKFRFLTQQLEEFYGPLHATRQEIAARSILRPKVSSAAGAAWHELYDGITDPERQREIEDREWPKYKGIIVYNNEQLLGELLPSYKKMLSLFREKMWLAEKSTRSHYQELVEFVDLWDRWLAGTLPAAVVEKIGHDESRLGPLYEDVADRLEIIRSRLQEKGH
jgi:hypothetical protein